MSFGCSSCAKGDVSSMLLANQTCYPKALHNSTSLMSHDSSSFEDDVLAVPDDNEMETMEETVLANEDRHL